MKTARWPRSGSVDEGALARFLAHPYFRRTPPKSLDRDDFAGSSPAWLSPKTARRP